MGTSHRRHTPCPILAGGHQQRHFFLHLWFFTANFIDYSGLNCLLQVRIRRNIQGPLSSVLRRLFGNRAFRAVSLYTHVAIWDLAFSIWVWWIFEGYFRFGIFGHQYMLAGVYLIGHNLDYLLFTTNGDIFLEWNQWAFGDGNWSFIICDNWRRICLFKHQWFAFA